MTEAPLLIWIDPEQVKNYTRKYKQAGDIKYVHTSYYHACFEAAVSLHHHLFKLTDTLLNRPDVGEREIADMLDDAQRGLDEWNRFLDAEEE